MPDTALEPLDLDHPHLKDAFREEIDFRADQIRDPEGLGSWKDTGRHRAPLRHFSIHLLLDLADELLAHRFKLEIHAAA